MDSDLQVCTKRLLEMREEHLNELAEKTEYINKLKQKIKTLNNKVRQYRTELDGM